LLLAFAIAYGAWMAAQKLPYWSVDTSLASSEWFNFQTDLKRALFAMFPGAVLWGASFPLAVAAAPHRNDGGNADTGTTVGRVYGANTLGAIGGSLLTGLVGVPLIGTQGTQRALIIVSVISAAVALLPLFHSSGEARPPVLGSRALVTFCVLLICAVWATANVRPVPAGLVAWGHLLASLGEPDALYVGEGINASIAVTEESN